MSHVMLSFLGRVPKTLYRKFFLKLLYFIETHETENCLFSVP